MTLEEEIKIQREYGLEEGIERGRIEGEKLGLERGRNEGEKLGLERGAAQKQREIAKNMKALKISLDNIAQATGLTLAEIETL